VLVNQIVEHLRLLIDRESLLFFDFINERRRDEVWVQEQVHHMLKSDSDTAVEREKGYPGSQERVDFWSTEKDGRESWIELKFCITNYLKSFTDSQVPQNITQEIGGILYDISKLKQLNASKVNRCVVFVAYPLGTDYLDHPEWHSHLERIREACSSVNVQFETEFAKGDHAAILVCYVANL